MTRTDFTALHAKCITDRETYFTEVRKTSIMLGKCTPEPLSFRERFALLTQEIGEHDAHLMYMETKRLLHRAALLGYGAPQDKSLEGATLALS